VSAGATTGMATVVRTMKWMTLNTKICSPTLEYWAEITAYALRLLCPRTCLWRYVTAPMHFKDFSSTSFITKFSTKIDIGYVLCIYRANACVLPSPSPLTIEPSDLALLHACIQGPYKSWVSSNRPPTGLMRITFGPTYCLSSGKVTISPTDLLTGVDPLPGQLGMVEEALGSGRPLPPPEVEYPAFIDWCDWWPDRVLYVGGEFGRVQGAFASRGYSLSVCRAVSAYIDPSKRSLQSP
jgi:hypothetical protein